MPTMVKPWSLGPEASLEVTPGPDEVSVTIRIPIESTVTTVPELR